MTKQKTLRKEIPTEYEEALVLVEWLKLKKLFFHHSPSETFTTSWNQKRKNTASGVSKGFPDYIILTPKGIIFIELKRTIGGVVSKEQKEWIKRINEIKGVEAIVAYGAEEAIQFTKQFI